MASTEAEARGVALPPGVQLPPEAPPTPAERAVPVGIAMAAAVSWRLLVIVAAGTLVIWAALHVLVVVIPLVVAILFTTLLHPAARRLQADGVPRTLSAIIVVALGLLVVAGVLALIIPPFASQAGDLANQVEQGARKLATTIAQLPLGISERQVNRAIDNVTNELDSGSVASGVVSGAMIVAEVAAAIVLTIFLTFFLVRDGDRIWTWIVSLSGPARRPTVNEAGRRAWLALSVYFRGVAFVATVDAVCIGAGILILGVPLALPLIVLTFLAAFFPIVGAVAAGAAAVLVALVTQGTTAAVILLVVIVLVQQLEGNVLYPILVGSQLNLHPVAMLLVLGVGGTVAGVAGAFLSVPLAAVAGAIINYARSAERHAIGLR